MTLRMFCLFAIMLMLSPAISNADVPNNWKTECIGRYQVSVPGEVEVALDSYKHLFDDSNYSQYRFSDDATAPFSHHHTVYPQMDTRESLEFMSTIKRKFDKNISERHQETGSVMVKKYAYWMSFSDVVSNRDFAWVEPGSYSLFIYRDGHYFNFGTSFEKTNNPAKDTQKSIAAIASIINSFHPRTLYSLPKQPGVCIPYGFIADDGTTSRNIAVTMRLIDHPDVEVGFQDSTDMEPIEQDGKYTGAYLDPKHAINRFFSSSGITNADEEVEANFSGYHSIQMSGRQGGAVFVTIKREDGSKDYGYVAAIQGDATTKPATPSQILYVIRTASRAKSKPISKDELKEMAKQIIASVKPHPVQ